MLGPKLRSTPPVLLWTYTNKWPSNHCIETFWAGFLFSDEHAPPSISRRWHHIKTNRYPDKDWTEKQHKENCRSLMNCHFTRVPHTPTVLDTSSMPQNNIGNYSGLYEYINSLLCVALFVLELLLPLQRRGRGPVFAGGWSGQGPDSKRSVLHTHGSKPTL